MSTAILHGAGLSRPFVSQRRRPALKIDILKVVRPCALALAACTLPAFLLPTLAMAALFVAPCVPMLLALWLFAAPADAIGSNVACTNTRAEPADTPRVLRGRLWDARDWAGGA